MSENKKKKVYYDNNTRQKIGQRSAVSITTYKINDKDIKNKSITSEQVRSDTLSWVDRGVNLGYSYDSPLKEGANIDDQLSISIPYYSEAEINEFIQFSNTPSLHSSTYTNFLNLQKNKNTINEDNSHEDDNVYSRSLSQNQLKLHKLQNVSSIDATNNQQYQKSDINLMQNDQYKGKSISTTSNLSPKIKQALSYFPITKQPFIPSEHHETIQTLETQPDISSPLSPYNETTSILHRAPAHYGSINMDTNVDLNQPSTSNLNKIKFIDSSKNNINNTANSQYNSNRETFKDHDSESYQNSNVLLNNSYRNKIKRINSSSINPFIIQLFKYLPAVFLGMLLNLLDSLSYGIIIFPKNDLMPNTAVESGISMFLVR